MRKHFLLLFLLTLLPLAGWATISVDTRPTLKQGGEYSGADKAVIEADGVATGNAATYTWYYAATTSNIAPAADAQNTWYTKANLKVKNAGTYYVYFKVISADPNEAPVAPTSINGTFVISKKALTVKYDNQSTISFEKKYGEANPALDQSKFTFEGFVGEEGNTSEKIAQLITGTVKYTLAKEDATLPPTGTTHISGVTDGRTMNFSGLNATNYKFTYPTGKMEIRQILFAATPTTIPADGKNYFTYAKNEGTLTYDATDQVASYTIKYYDAQGNVHDLSVSTGNTAQTIKDYKFKTFKKKNATGNTYANASTAHADAGTYKPTITAEATSNYYGDIELTDDENSLDFTINKRDVYVFVNSDSKVYDGKPYDTTYKAGKVTFTQMKGLVLSSETPSDPNVVSGISIAYADEAGLTDELKKSVNKDGFRMIPVVAENSNLRTNHNVNILENGRWKITKRPIKVTAKPQTITFGQPAPLFAANDTYLTIEGKGTDKGLITPTPVEGDQQSVTTAFEAEKAKFFAALNVGLNGTYTAVNEDGYENAIVVALKTGTDDATVAALKAVANYEIQPVAGTYTIKGAAYTMIAMSKTITYGDKYTLDDFKYITSGADVAAGQKVEFELWKDGKKLTSLPKDAGEYEIRFVEKDAYLPAGYKLPINYVSETFTINPKKVYPIIAEQILMVGDTKDALLKDKVSFVEDPDAETKVNGIVDNDVIGFALDFNGLTAGTDIHSDESAIDANKTLEGAIVLTAGNTFTPDQATAYNTAYPSDNAVTNKTTITDDHVAKANAYNATLEGAVAAGMLMNATYYAEGVKGSAVAATTAAPNANANYDITWTDVYGKLTVVPNNTLALNFSDNDAVNIQKLDGKTVNTVTMGVKTMVGDNWHTMVLPFATTPLELSRQLDKYVVVNRLSAEKSSATHVAFELELSAIPAGEAFLIKCADDIEWNHVNFAAKKISKTIVAEAKGGNKLVGVYKNTSVQSTDAQKIGWLGNTAQFKKDGETHRENKWYEPYSEATVIAPFEAYLMYAPGVSQAPLITVEEADGTVTAISEVKAGEFQAIKTDGWYTLNGVKLQGAPTEKGIYINNGKKVVVK